MALWKDTPAPAPATAASPAKAATDRLTPPATPAAPDDATRRLPTAASAPKASVSEAVIAAGLTMEGKIGGGGDVRIAGRFKGDVNVEGNCRIDAGGHLEGDIKASNVTVGGELQGNINALKHVDVLTTGVIVGDVRAASIAVAAGSCMRGQVEFGWDDQPVAPNVRRST